MSFRISDLFSYVLIPLVLILVILLHQYFYTRDDGFIWYENLGVSLNLIAISLLAPLLFTDNLYSIKFFRLDKALNSFKEGGANEIREYCFNVPYDNHKEIRRLDWQLAIIAVYSFSSLNYAVQYEIESEWWFSSLLIGFTNCVLVWIVIFSKVTINDNPKIEKNIF